jgi:hypothetical protein
MKTNLLLLIITAFFLNACSVGVKKDLLTGLTVKNNGLSFEESYLMMDNVKMVTNEFPVGKVIYMYFDGVSGFLTKDGLVYLGASLVILDEKGNKIMDYADLFSEYDKDGVAPENTKALNVNLTIGDPMKEGGKYIWKSKIWDKNGEGAIEAEIEFVVK